MNIENIQPLGTAKRKLIASLQQAKHRKETGLFVAEGYKCISELIDTFNCRMIVATAAWIESGKFELPHGCELYKGSRADMERISSMNNAPEVIAVMEIPAPEERINTKGMILVLDGVQDPGNFGTILRACDWFGVRTVVCSNDTVDVYNHKVIQSTMGALARVEVVYRDLPLWLSKLPAEMPVYGTFLDGENVYTADLSNRGVIVMGNEGKGISAKVAKAVTRRLFIPPYPREARHVESLNVSMATAVILSQFRKLG